MKVGPPESPLQTLLEPWKLKVVGPTWEMVLPPMRLVPKSFAFSPVLPKPTRVMLWPACGAETAMGEGVTPWTGCCRITTATSAELPPP